MRNISFLKNQLFRRCGSSKKADSVQQYLLRQGRSSGDIFILGNSSTKKWLLQKVTALTTSYSPEKTVRQKFLSEKIGMLQINNWFKDMNLSKTELFKGYLRYKMITFQNVPFEAQITNFFISQKNYVPFSRYSSFCIFNNPVIYQICDVTMSIST